MMRPKFTYHCWIRFEVVGDSHDDDDDCAMEELMSVLRCCCFRLLCWWYGAYNKAALYKKIVISAVWSSTIGIYIKKCQAITQIGSGH